MQKMGRDCKGAAKTSNPAGCRKQVPLKRLFIIFGQSPFAGALPLSVWLGLLFPHHSEQHLRLFLQDLIEAPAEVDVEGQIEEHVSGGADVL